MDAATVESARCWAGAWERLVEATAARAECERAGRAALAAGDTTGCAVAAFDLETALLAESNARTELAGVFLFALQAAIDTQPNELFGKVMAFGTRQEMKRVVAWLVSCQEGSFTSLIEYETRLQAAEVELKQSRAESWRLANALAALEARIEQRIEQTERPTDDYTAHRGTSEGTAPGEAGGARAADVGPDHVR